VGKLKRTGSGAMVEERCAFPQDYLRDIRLIGGDPTTPQSHAFTENQMFTHTYKQSTVRSFEVSDHTSFIPMQKDKYTFRRNNIYQSQTYTVNNK
jgi:hypothetical protein